MRQTGFIGSTVLAALVLAGCSSAPESAVTVSYELDGTEYSQTIHPETVTCGENGTRGVAIVDEPTGQFSFRAPDEPGAGQVMAAVVAEGDGDSQTFVYFEGEEGDPDTSTAGVVTLAETVGTAILIEDWDPSLGTEFTREDGTEVEATVSGEVRCDTD